MKITVEIDNMFFDEEKIDDIAEIARIIKNHLSHLGHVRVFYEKPFKELSWWRKALLYSIGRTE